MQVRTYRARNLKEALQMVQHELGPEARIVQTRELETKWWDRFARGRQFEIRTRRPGPQPLPLRRRGAPPTEASEVTLPDRTATPPLASDDFAVSPEEFPALDLSHPSSWSTFIPSPPAASDVPPAPASAAVRDELAAWFELLAQLIDADVPEAAARELIESVRSTFTQPRPTVAQQHDALTSYLAREIRTCSPISASAAAGQRRTVALIGPTGVGKTTTIAKLAANLRLREHRRVGLITVDTFRIAAVEQLRTYAQIMDLPMEVVATPSEMSSAVARLADQDLILIDTAGHSPRDVVQLQQLKSLLAEAQADETHLVVSAVSSTSHLHEILHRFAALGATALILTKVDETMSLGNVLPALRGSQLPVSYLTCGQSVPDDIVTAQQASLISVLIGQQPIAALV
jgi:flagellar biosynthesis protein FlhF